MMSLILVLQGEERNLGMRCHIGSYVYVCTYELNNTPVDLARVEATRDRLRDKSDNLITCGKLTTSPHIEGEEWMY